MQPQHSVIIPTFPPIFVTLLPLLNITSSSSPVVTSTITDNLHLAGSQLKLNTVHHYPSSHFICSNCHRTIKCCNVNVQTSLNDHDAISRTRTVSLMASDEELNSDTTLPLYSNEISRGGCGFRTELRELLLATLTHTHTPTAIPSNRSLHFQLFQSIDKI
ncbi:unnamed protein product [Rotaria sp. Silwood2]|nr:unnamed protein product [Rotaria sp. Silwood2]CAF2874627.1 unnamed protein product [Rotaria sp. Silwood2]CAF4196979.1 unnamed protein product [Rotaria sp. Silwood2]CAF4345916.1 unnamed protein product [Rotaria sp. Silwood2]CAF4548413.1 unnamed protein product [Rotaria sp. Silwood2]